MASMVYLLCAITSFVLALLQWRAYLKGRTQFLLWTTVCFFALFANNVLLYVDLVTLPTEVSLLVPRSLILLCGLGALIYGFIWETN